MIFVHSGCKEHYPPRYGVEFNPTRERLGVKPLNEDLILDSPPEKYKTVWRNPNIDKSKPHHSYKRVLYSNGVLLADMDSYTSNKTFKLKDGVAREFVIIRFYYRPANVEVGFDGGYVKKLVSGWHCSYRHEGCDLMYEVITKSQADSIIASWGITDK